MNRLGGPQSSVLSDRQEWRAAADGPSGGLAEAFGAWLDTLEQQYVKGKIAEDALIQRSATALDVDKPEVINRFAMLTRKHSQ
jgi:hypothetical protein